jgi:putative RecB family exonuclease
MKQPEQLSLDGMPERLFVCTPSKLAAYEDCPRRYRYAYLDRPAPPKGPPWAHNSLGASVHNALKNWYGLPPDQRGSGVLSRLLKATWVAEGYRDVDQQRAVYRRALDWLADYVHGLDPAEEPVGVERVVATRTSVLAFSGRVDRIDRRGDELVIVDYKTGRATLTGDDARGSRALALYAFAAGRTMRRRCQRVELHHLPTGEVAAHEHTDASLARHVSRAEDTARDIVAAERAVAAGTDRDEAFPTTPGPRCSWCDWRRSCPVGAQAPEREPWSSVERLVTPDVTADVTADPEVLPPAQRSATIPEPENLSG